MLQNYSYYVKKQKLYADSLARNWCKILNFSKGRGRTVSCPLIMQWIGKYFDDTIGEFSKARAWMGQFGIKRNQSGCSIPVEREQGGERKSERI